ncbi:MAG: ribonuclease E/G [Alphaproteobacteria bacterium]|nr:ribonuclease E/G [Alphaproteobacteria bacterium]
MFIIRLLVLAINLTIKKIMSNIQLIFQSSSFYQEVFQLKENILQNVLYQNQNTPKVNSIYLARVDKIVDSLGGAFVSLGKEDAFLKLNKNKDSAKVGEKFLVQVVKTATNPNKLAVVSKDISLQGGLIILKPFSKNIIFSKKLTEDDKQNVLKHTDLGYGFIVRSLYKHSFLTDLLAEVNRLKNLWESIKTKTKIGLVYESNFLENIIVDSAKSSSLEVITNTVEDNNLVHNILADYKYLNIQSKIYAGKENILDKYNIAEQLIDVASSSLQLNDSLNLLFFEREAFNYIDVNFAGEVSFTSREDVAYKVNMEIMPIIVRQILLRNLSGQILIDILKITNKLYRNNILDKAKKLFADDNNKATVLGFSNLGILEVSRQKRQDSFNLVNKSKEYQSHIAAIRG